METFLYSLYILGIPFILTTTINLLVMKGTKEKDWHLKKSIGVLIIALIPYLFGLILTTLSAEEDVFFAVTLVSNLVICTFTSIALQSLFLQKNEKMTLKKIIFISVLNGIILCFSIFISISTSLAYYLTN